YWSWMWHYDAVLMPLAVAALLDALGPRPAAAAPADTGTAPDTSTPPVTSHPPAGTGQARAHRRRTALALGAAGLRIVLTAPDLPVARLADPATWQPSPRADAAREVLDTVPDGAVVASDISLLAYLVPTTTTLWSGNPDNPVAEYYVIDQQGATW